MKKFLLITSVFMLVGCTEKLTCTRDNMKYMLYDSEEVITGENQMIFTFEKDTVTKIETIVDFKENYTDEICDAYSVENSKCEGTKIITNGKDVSEYKNISLEDLKKQMEDEGYTCK